MNFITRVLAVLLWTAFMAGASGAVQPYKVVKRVPIGGEGRWEHIAFDPSARRIYVACDTRVIVVDADSLKVVGDVSGIRGARNVMPVAELGRGFTANTDSDTVTMFDLHTLKTLGIIKAGDAPHGLVFDPASKRLFVLNQRSHDVTVIDTVRGQALGLVPLPGRPDLAVHDGKGHLLVSFPEQNEVVKLDTTRLVVSARWSVAPGKRPTGIAYDFRNQRLFVGCSNRQLVVLDAASGKLMAALPIGAGVNGIRYDSGAHMVFASNGADGTLTVVHEDAPGKYSVVQNVPTAIGAATLTIDRLKHNVYTVAGPNRSARRGAQPASSGLELFVISSLGN